MLDSKFKRVLVHLGVNLAAIIIIGLLSSGATFGSPSSLAFLIFMLIPETVWYFLFDRKDTDGLFGRILYFIVMAVLLLAVIIAAAAGISEFNYYDGEISLIQYAALAATPVAVAVSTFAFLILNHHFCDANVIYPFVPAASCVVGYLLGLGICAIPGMKIAGGFVFFGIAIVAYIIYIKKTDLPMSGYYSSFGKSSYKPSTYKPTTTTYKPTTTTYTPTTTTATSVGNNKPIVKTNTDRQDFIRSLVNYHCYIDRTCCSGMVKMEATVEAVCKGDTITIEATRTDVDTYDLEHKEMTQSQANSYLSEYKDRLYYWKLDINRKVDQYYNQLEPLVDRYNATHSDGFDLESYHVE